GDWGDGACDCDQSVGQTIGRSLQSGTHLGFYRLSKMSLADAVLYIVAQFAGAIAGVCVARYVLPETFGHRAIRYAVTAPRARGSAVAFIGEVAISFVLMSTILVASNRETLARY